MCGSVSKLLYVSVLCPEKPPWFFWVWCLRLIVVCFLLVSGFWLLRLVIPTGAAVTVAELFLNSVQQCSFILLLKCCFCLAVVGGFVFSCGTVVSVLAARSLHFCCSTLREEGGGGYNPLPQLFCVVIFVFVHFCVPVCANMHPLGGGLLKLLRRLFHTEWLVC